MLILFIPYPIIIIYTVLYIWHYMYGCVLPVDKDTCSALVETQACRDWSVQHSLGIQNSESYAWRYKTVLTS